MTAPSTSLDDQAMAMADRIAAAGKPGEAEALRAAMAYLRETVRGTHDHDNLADALQSIAENAESAAQIVADHLEEMAHPPLTGDAVADMANLLVAEHRGANDDAGDLSGLLTRGLWEAAQELGRTAAASVQMADAPEEDIVLAGAALLIRRRPGSWESEIVMAWVREGETVPRYVDRDRLQQFVGCLTELGRSEPARDVPDLLSQALGRAAIEVGSVDELVGYSFLERLEAMAGPHGPQPS